MVEPGVERTSGPTRDVPLVKFFRFVPGARAPQRADKSAAGVDANARLPLLRGDADRLRARLVFFPPMASS